jgi:hypothetical protein
LDDRRPFRSRQPGGAVQPFGLLASAVIEYVDSLGRTS